MTDIPGLIDAALQHHRAGRLDDAEALYRQVIAADAGHPDALYLLGLIHYHFNRHEEGLELVQRAIASSDVTPAYHNTLAKLLDAIGDVAGALAAYRRTLALAPDEVDAHVGLGVLLHEHGETAAAIDEYRRALELEPDRAYIRDTLLSTAEAGLFLGLSSGFQGAHAPERQVFMSAAVSLKRGLDHPLRILEIGSYMGASALTWAYAIDVLIGAPGYLLCVDHWSDAHVDRSSRGSSHPGMREMVRYLGPSDRAYMAFLRNIATAAPATKIEHRRGTSAAILPTLPAGSFDIVYIDAGHAYADVLADIRNAGRVLSDGGFLCGDDLELQAGDCDLEHARAHAADDFITDPRSGTGHHPGVTLAVDEALGQVSVYGGFWIMQKTGDSYRTVDLSGAEGLLPRHWPLNIVEQLRSRFGKSKELKSIRDQP
jgi:tetratricopeptide (TPR) repeat protein